MDVKQNTEYWLKTAAHDMEVAETLFQNQKYDWCLFVGHLVIEKTLKVFYVRDKEEIPPKIHNLVKLAENTNLSLTEDRLVFLADVNDFNNIETRYPDAQFSFIRPVPENLPKNNFQ